MDVSADCRVTLLIEIPGEGDGLMASTAAIHNGGEPHRLELKPVFPGQKATAIHFFLGR
jgi:hypothetical protein